MPTHAHIKPIGLKVTPEELIHINQCAALAKKNRAEFIRHLINLAWRDAVRCGLVKEAGDEQPNQKTT